MKNRALPYINSLVTSLMGSHESYEDAKHQSQNVQNPNQQNQNQHQYQGTKEAAGYPLLSFAKLNVLDMERNDRNYDDIRENVRGLPFLNVRHVYYEDEDEDDNIHSAWMKIMNSFQTFWGRGGGSNSDSVSGNGSGNDNGSGSGNDRGSGSVSGNDNASGNASGNDDEKMYRNSKRLIQVEDFLHSAHICIESGLQWCLMMEEFTVVPADFLPSLKRFVIAPLESQIAAHHSVYVSDNDNNANNDNDKRSDEEKEEELVQKTMSVVSLFSAYSTETESAMKIHDVEYSMTRYESDRAKLNSERRALWMDRYAEEYRMIPIQDHQAGDINAKAKTKGDDINSNHVKGGFNSAMLFSMTNVRTHLIPMLEKMKSKEQNRIQSFSSSSGGVSNSNSNSNLNADELFDIEREFSLYTGVSRYRIEPSLVNRIGFYDELLTAEARDSNAAAPAPVGTLGITNWLTDPRFLFEAGSYWEGAIEYCKTWEGNWIWDALFFQEDHSCCDLKDISLPKCIEEATYWKNHEFKRRETEGKL